MPPVLEGGAREAFGAWTDGVTPEPNLTVSQWADEHRVLHGRAANEAGPWRTARTPYLEGIMDALSPSHPAQRVVFMKGAQVGGTEAGNNWLGFIIHHAPGPAMAVLPTVELAKRASQQRIDPMIEVCPALRERVAPARKRDSGNTVLSKEFPGGILIMTGANSAVGLRSMPARYLFLDEVDAYPESADDEGDPINLAIARTRTFSYRRKILLVSTPKFAGASRIEREYERTDRRRYFVPCPHRPHRSSLIAGVKPAGPPSDVRRWTSPARRRVMDQTTNQTVRGDAVREVGAFEAKSKLGQLLDRVEAGEEIVITRRGKVVAKLVPPGAGNADAERARSAARRIRAMRRGVTLGGKLKIKDLIAEGRL